MNNYYTEKLLVKIIEAQNILLKGGKIHCSRKDISSMEVETILHSTNYLFTSNELANLLGVDRLVMQKSYNRAVKRMKIWKKYYWFFVIGILTTLFIVLGSMMGLSTIILNYINSIFPGFFTLFH